LAVIADLGNSYQIRLAATRAVQSMMEPEHHLRRESAEELLSKVRAPWAKREHIIDRRAVMLPVSRPPKSLLDVWEV